MADSSDVTSGARGPRAGVRVQVRRSAPGPMRYAASSDHVISVHASGPARVSCLKGGLAVRSRGEVDILPAGEAEEHFLDDPTEAVDVALPASVVRLAAEEMGLDPDRAGVAARYHLRDVQIEHIVWALEAEHRAGRPNGLVFQEGLGLALAARLLANYRVEAADRRGLSPPQLRRVTEFIEQQLDRDLSLVRLARVSGASASHFRELFKRSTGLPVHRYVVQRRVERARALLEAGELPPSEVALAAGFSHQSHMARCMRRVLGVRPSSIARRRP